MRINDVKPKTFSIYVENENKKGYIRHLSIQDEYGKLLKRLYITSKEREASCYVNFDNVKAIATKLQEKYNFECVKIVDNKTKKMYYVKKETK